MFEVSDVLLLCSLFDGIVSEHFVERGQSLVVNRLQSRAEEHSLIVSLPPESHEICHSSHVVLHRENLLPLVGELAAVDTDLETFYGFSLQAGLPHSE